MNKFSACFRMLIIFAVFLTVGSHTVHAATRSWIAPVSGSWTDPTRWTPSGVPGPTDDVQITVDGTYTVTLTGSQSVNSVTVGQAGNTGVQTLWIQGLPTLVATLTAATGFTNFGTLRLESASGFGASNLIVTSGTLTNASGGVVNVNPGLGGPRTVTANIDNQGSINSNYFLTLNKSGGVYNNTGTIGVASGYTLTVSGGTLNQSGTFTVTGSAVFNTSSTVNQNGGSLGVPGLLTVNTGALNLNGGGVTGNVLLQNAALILGASASVSSSYFTMQG